MQHACGGWKANHALWCHLYLVPRDTELKDAIAIADGDSMQRYVQNNRNVLWCNLNLLRMSDKKEAADDIETTSTISVDRFGGGDENNSTDQWPEYRIDVPIDEYQQRVNE